MEGMKRSVARGRNPFGAGTVFQYTGNHDNSDLMSRNPFGAGTVFQSPNVQPLARTSGRNPFGAGTVFQYLPKALVSLKDASQSLWSRDGFSIPHDNWRYHDKPVAIPLEQGRFFNWLTSVKIVRKESQSLWSRDGFSIDGTDRRTPTNRRNPFGAGTVFQLEGTLEDVAEACRNPFGAGTVFQCISTPPMVRNMGRNPFGAGTVFQ